MKAHKKHENEDENNEKSEFYILILLVFIALLFRLYNISSSMWTDEFATYWVSSANSAMQCIQRTLQTQGMSPFYFLIERFFIKTLPANELSIRLFSLICSLISMFLLFTLSNKIFPDKKHTGLFSAIIFGIYQSQIYYAQEARPYSLAFAIILASFIFLFRFLENNKNTNYFLYIIFSVMIFYCHYVYAYVYIVQNFYFFYIFYFKKGKYKCSLKKWFIGQLFIAIFCLIFIPQLAPMLRNRGKWSWLELPSFIDSLIIYFNLFTPKFLLVLSLLFGLIYLSKRKEIVELYKKENKNNYIFLISWIILPFIIVYVVSLILGVSFIAARYMLVVQLPFFILLARLTVIIKTPRIAYLIPSLTIIIYISLITIPTYQQTNSFCRRIPHNWKNAIAYINKHQLSKDFIILRTGFVKENWIPQKTTKTIKEYVKAPLLSFYYENKFNIPIYNMTYTWEKEFYPYYDEIFKESQRKERIWLIGVNPPNTNYPISNISKILKNNYNWKVKFKKNFSGVFLALFTKKM